MKSCLAIKKRLGTFVTSQYGQDSWLQEKIKVLDTMRAPSTCVKFSQGMLSQHELLSRRGIGWLGGDFSLVFQSFWFLCHGIVLLFQRLNTSLKKNSLLCSTQWKLLSQNISFQILFSVHTHTTSFISIILRSCLLLGREAMTNLDNILKSRDITLPA